MFGGALLHIPSSHNSLSIFIPKHNGPLCFIEGSYSGCGEWMATPDTVKLPACFNTFAAGV